MWSPGAGVFPGHEPAGAAIGESCELSDHPHHASFVASGNHAGHTQRQLVARHRDELLGPPTDQHERLPWRIKLLSLRNRLSVQVHPDTERVQHLLPGDEAKSEACLVLDARPASRIYASLHPRIGAAKLREAGCGPRRAWHGSGNGWAAATKPSA